MYQTKTIVYHPVWFGNTYLCTHNTVMLQTRACTQDSQGKALLMEMVICINTFATILTPSLYLTFEILT